MPPIRYRCQSIEIGNVDIHVRTLRDRQQFDDPSGIAEKLGISSATWPLFGIIWPSGEALAYLVSTIDVQGKRILEVGCGIGLPSLLLNHLHADITATDYHPEVERFLRENTRLNDDDDIPFVRTGWDDAESGLGVFDLIIGSDLLYEQEHPALLSRFINRHAKSHCDVIITDPGRGHSGRFDRHMKQLGFRRHDVPLDNPQSSYQGRALGYDR